ncbi:MAG: hypothetical protein KDA30_14920 [Phycisphaerales bacterium]|nr:hypothetical protein [Phycisphaerales bacterium]
MNDAELIRAFNEAALPKEDWTHEAHLRVRLLYSREYPFDEALSRLRTAIIRLNHAHGTVDTPTSGYHETVTHAWLLVLRAALQADDNHADTRDILAAHPEFADKKYLLGYYSRDRIMSPEAKRSFVEPDLAKLPAHK